MNKTRSYGAVRVLAQHPEADEVHGATFDLLDDDFTTIEDAEKFIRDRGREDCTYAIIRLVSTYRVEIKTIERRRLIVADEATEE